MIEITPFKQSDDSLCGPACVKMILNFYGIQAEEGEIAKRCNHTYELGTNDYNMRDALESYGLCVSILNESSLETIKWWLDRNIPVIVDWFSGGFEPLESDLPNGHSSIAIDLDNEYIYLLDPEFGGIRKIAREDFMRCWFDWREPLISAEKSNLVLRQIIVAHEKDLL